MKQRKAYHAKLIQGGMVVAAVIAPTKEEAEKEMAHYAAVYSQDGPVTITMRKAPPVRSR